MRCCKTVFVLLSAAIISGYSLTSSCEKSPTNDRIKQLKIKGRFVYVAMVDFLFPNNLTPQEVQKYRAFLGSNRQYSAERFNSSTDVFRHLVAAGLFGGGFEYFGADENARKVDMRDPEEFTDQFNVWCLVRDFNGDVSSETPIMFTKNIILEGEMLDGRISFSKAEVQGVGPYCVIIRFSGVIDVLHQTELDSRFNIARTKLKVLYP